MSVWGRLAEAAAEIAAGARRVFDHDGGGKPEHQVAFTIGVIALGAKMAKADGVVTRDEVIAFREVFKVPEREMENVSRIFNAAKQDSLGYEAYAARLAFLLKDNRKLLQDVLEGLFHIALADGVFHPNEERFLAEVAKRFGFTDTEFSYVRARHMRPAKASPYEVLGIPPGIDNKALKAHYHKLLLDNHPDKMIARGVPPEFVCFATKTVAAINAAYAEIARERRI
jgi:DnaJ like chaperone protein